MVAHNKLPVLDLVSDQMRAVLDTSAELAPDAYATDAGLDAMRQAYLKERSFWNEGGPAMAGTIDDRVPTPHGEVAIRCHLPVVGTGLPAVVYVHGGGWVVGNLDTHDRIMRALAAESGAAVIGVDYALSPEAKFPVAIEQCAAVARQLHDHGGDYSIDGGRLAFAGDSGGATMSLATTLLLRDQADAGAPSVDISALALYYGMYGLRDSKSRRLLGGPWDGLTPDDLAYYLDCHLADPADASSPYFDCLSADLSRGVPPAYLVAAELDPLRDDTATLAAMLTGHGVPCTHEVFPGVLHAFLHNSRMLDAASAALANGGAFLRRALDLTE
ncbi:MAG: acetyl esterase [Propionibacteriaceae bacterium]|nr:acetyl esterase [Propionibacteriaceae bacterium]